MTVFELQPDVVTPENYADADFERETRRLYLESKRGLLTATPASMAYVPVSAVLAHPTAASTLERQAHRFAIAHPPSSREYLLNQALKDQFSPTSRLGQVEYILDHGNYSPVYRSGSSGEETTTTTKHATLMQVLQYPYSRGCIHIDPAEAAAGKVVIDPKYYEGEGELDREVMAAAQAFGDRICRTAPMKDLVRRRVYPPEEVDCDWKTWVRDNTITDWHPVGTCSMLPRARGGVVDPALRVYGTSNLRVVDASIFPLHISAHIQATVYAVAEKAADCIKQTWDTPLRARL
jgi:choline dehydrogenase-like flavoprotein